MKMKVRVDKLKKAIEKYEEQDKRRFERETTQYEEHEKIANARYLNNVALYLAQLKGGRERIDGYELNNHLSRGCKFPSKVHPAKTYGDLLTKLGLAEDQILVVDDHSEYMRFITGKCVCD